MKPLNLDNKPCSPISSNCVVWQGPDIPCINLCTGDTVSDVVSAMATELCTILDTLKVSNYDLTCFNLQACGPEDFQALIQFLITKICELEGVTPETKDVPTCPDCVVSVAECFVTGTQTTMQLVDYVQLIGERICSLITEIGLITAQITDILIRLTDLENAPAPTFTIPTVDLTACDLSATVVAGASYDVDLLLGTLINDSTYGYCALIGATGLPADIISAVTSQEPCISESTSTLSNPGTPYGTEYPTWVNNPATIADSIVNIWLTLCDIHTAVSASSIEILDEGVSLTTDVSSIDFVGDGVTATNVGDAVTVTIPGSPSISDTGWVDLEGFTWYGVNNQNGKRVPQCRRIGNVVHFRGVVMIPLEDGIGGPPLQWDYDGSTIDTYFGNTTTAPSTAGAESVVLAVGGSVTFNQGNSVIPTSVVDGGTNFDNTYISNYAIASRLIEIDTNISGTLNSLLRLSITDDKKLKLVLVKDLEESAGGTFGANPVSTSIANNLISHVRTGEFVPQYQGSTMATNPASGTQTVTLNYDPALTYPFDCDANDQTQLGGFGWVQLDGLIAYLEP